MKILVTGATGFIGTKLLERLDTQVYEVFGLMHRSHHFKQIPNVKYINRKEIADDYDFIFHLASSGEKLNHSKKNNSDLGLTKYILKRIDKNKIKKFIFTSSWGVYAPQNKSRLKETDSLSPIDNYGQSKKEIEEELQLFFQKDQEKLLIYRISTVYGPEQKKLGTIYNITGKALTNRNIIINKNVQRDYIHVTDVVSALLLALRGKMSGIYNLGSGEKYELLSLAKMIKKISGSKSQIKLFDGKPSRNILSVSKLKRSGFRQKLKIKDGLSDYINNFFL